MLPVKLVGKSNLRRTLKGTSVSMKMVVCPRCFIVIIRVVAAPSQA
ncbi:hypothetical protein A2U01_0085827, partial [Trifolium medium]|nr:hypothetical protein [Trifolium medium]